jgi:hypothetical protein
VLVGVITVVLVIVVDGAIPTVVSIIVVDDVIPTIVNNNNW